MKKLISLTLACLLALLCFAGCSGNNTQSAALTKISVAASATPHSELLEKCVEQMKSKGYELVIKTMDDYVTPNTATESGDVDANYFQHTPYLDDFNKENGTHLVSVGKIHYEPYGIYAGTCNDLNALPDGAKIAVPNDATNEARALLLLEANGLIKLKEGVGLTATVKDITENPKNLVINEMEAALIPGVLSELSVAVINGNYAIGAGLKVKDALAVEDSTSDAAQTFANVLVVKEGNENNAAVLALLEILQSDEIASYMDEKYEGAVLPIK